MLSAAANSAAKGALSCGRHAQRRQPAKFLSNVHYRNATIAYGNQDLQQLPRSSSINLS